jgi:hypothetical protein
VKPFTRPNRPRRLSLTQRYQSTLPYLSDSEFMAVTQEWGEGQTQPSRCRLCAGQFSLASPAFMPMVLADLPHSQGTNDLTVGGCVRW